MTEYGLWGGTDCDLCLHSSYARNLHMQSSGMRHRRSLAVRGITNTFRIGAQRTSAGPSIYSTTAKGILGF